MKLVWTAALSVGHRALDQDHRDLFALVNRFTEAADLPAAHQALLAVDAYSREHFAREESVMSLAGYHGLAEHRVLHAAILADIKRLLLSDLTGGRSRRPETVIREVAALLEGWIFDHVMCEDCKMRPAVADLAQRIVAQRRQR